VIQPLNKHKEKTMNLEGLAPTSDVSISVFQSMLKVQFVSFQLFDAHIQDLSSLEAVDIYVLKHAGQPIN